MNLLQAQNIARHFGAEILFNKVNIEVKTNDRIGLVGRNGAGKSTILHILAGLEEADEGRVSKKKEITVGFLDQHSGLDTDKTVYDEMLIIFDYVIQLEKDMRKVEEKMGTLNASEDPEEYSDLLRTYDHMQVEFNQLNGYSYENDIRTVLHGFRFYEEDFDKEVSQLSGGQKARLALAKLLLERKDLLILDEPTNHLDIETLAWLENYLKNYKGALLIVSHDRYFLDNVTNDTYEVSRGKVQHFPGNYSKYLELKSEQLKTQWKEYEKQQKEITKLEEFVDRNIVRASTTKRAQSKRKQLEKMDRIEKPKDNSKSASFTFQIYRESGNVVAQTNNLAIGYPNAELSSNINLDVRKTESIALVGPNGVGKTTLLKTLTGKLPALEGSVETGTKVDIGYYDQEQQHLHNHKTVLDEVWDEHPRTPEVDIRTLLGSFLFSGSDVEKSVSSLSGGEKSRVALAKLSMEKNNFLVLDEPTNHLDIDSKEVLENALIDFEGTLLFVSHDRYFINRMATKVIEIEADGVKVYLGDYDYYLQKKEELEALEQLKQEESNTNNQSNEQENQTSDNLSTATLDREALKEQQKRIRKINRRIEEIETDLEEIDKETVQYSEQLSDPSIYENPDKMSEITNLHSELEEKQLLLMEEWEELNEELEQYQ